ncbi:hypothetical protein Ancab_012031 [Ancistrocladus abbreviatus]
MDIANSSNSVLNPPIDSWDVNMFVLLLAAFLLNSSFIQAKNGVTSSRLATPPMGTRKTIKGSNGDIIDCVDIYRQPALINSSHSIQMKPSFYPEGTRPSHHLPAKLRQPWQKHGRCPHGTIPIRRKPKTPPSVKLKRALPSKPAFATNEYHQDGPQWLYSDPYVTTGYYPLTWPGNYGARAMLNVWKPKVARSTDWSQVNMLFIADDGDENYSVLNVGWIVYPVVYGDDMPRLSVCATTLYKTKCDLDCFVQTNNQYGIGDALNPSTFNGPQSEIDVVVRLDKTTANWWLFVQDQAIGYWPNETVPILQYGADFVYWRGDIYGDRIGTQMGSGYFADKGFGKAAYIRGMKYINGSGAEVLLKMEDFSETSNNLAACYNYWFNSNNIDVLFFYGGPGCEA